MNHYTPNTGYVNVIYTACINCHDVCILNEQNPICDVCQGWERGYQHLKEKRIDDVFRENNIGITIRDMRVESGLCPGKRPDFLIDCGTHAVVVEVDEKQHGHIAASCENTRMGSIYNSYSLPNMVFIRYNPDNYIDPLGNKIYGKPTNPSREKFLVDMVRKLMAEPLNKLWSVKLFYDGYNGAPEFIEHEYTGTPKEKT
jgi:hypothetical protein